METTDDKRVFVDTNVLLAATDTDRSKHADARAFFEAVLPGTWRAFASSQVLREYLVVATLPIESNGLGLPPADACQNVRAFQQLVQILPEGQESQDRLTALIRHHGLRGKRIHDANLVAVMDTHGLVQIKTYNGQDFSAFEHIIQVPGLVE
ncbi:MAG: PIN domain-containing protein [Puniceicoccaceae bacterium]|nr:MAG: PIN domain-containing protein [Puniceicoccaceae bacterium]